jgi:hypothetical protein
MLRFFLAYVCVGVSSFSYATEYYVDPVAGKPFNDGSVSRPWKTLQGVFESPVFFKEGDVLWLLRGYHGEPVVRGWLNGPVKIMAVPGHTAVMGRLVFSQARFWSVEDVYVLGEYGALSQAPLVEFTQNATGNSLLRSTVGSWMSARPDEVLGKASYLRVGVKYVSGSRNMLKQSHVINVLQGVVAQSSLNQIEDNVFEHVLGYVWEAQAGGNLWQKNSVYNVLQSAQPSGWMKVSGSGRYNQTVRLNTVLCTSQPENPFYKKDFTLLEWGDVDVANMLIQGNVTVSQSETAVVLGSAYNVLLAGNTFMALMPNNPLPWVKVGQTDSRKFLSSKNLVFNNIAGGYMWLNWDGSSPLLESGGNVSVHPDEVVSTFVSPWFPKYDMHLTEEAGIAIGSAHPAYVYPVDRDLNPRPYAESADAGAFEYGYVTSPDIQPPSQVPYPHTVWIPGVGMDVVWERAHDNRVVAGYDVYRNGTHIARVRAQNHFLDKAQSFTPGLHYTVKAFDASGNGLF